MRIIINKKYFYDIIQYKYISKYNYIRHNFIEKSLYSFLDLCSYAKFVVPFDNKYYFKFDSCLNHKYKYGHTDHYIYFLCG